MRRRLFATLMLAAGMLFAAPAAALADGITMNGAATGGTVTVDDAANTITVSGNATMNGTGDAFEISSDATLVFQDGATLTLTGYDNAFVVSNATLSGGGWNITDGDGMDLFRLKTSGKLSIDDDVTLTGNGTDAATETANASRAIVLESGSGQAVTLNQGGSLEATDFYRGMETGGASDYTISGQGMDSSTFDFSGNDCGIAISYFDSDCTYMDCKLEVSECLSSGIFMRQDNAALDGLTIDGVWINCVNPYGFEQNDIAVRFHSNNFTITDSKINIENARNTGLWIYDGWNSNERNEITDSQISVKGVSANTDLALFGASMRQKAITFVPYRPWLISGCTITMEGASYSDSDLLDGGLNIASDIQRKTEGFNIKAKPNMYGGTIRLEDTEIRTACIDIADIGVQIGQFLEIGENVVIDNDHNNAEWKEHFTILCDHIDNGYQAVVIGIPINISYDTTGMSEETKVDDRVEVTGGSYYSTRNPNLQVLGKDVFDSTVPINGKGDKLEMFVVDEDAFAAYVDQGVISLLSAEGTYDYAVRDASPDTYRYIWAPVATVTFVDGSGSTVETVSVPRGAAFGLTADLPEGSWNLDLDDVVNGDVTVSPRAV